MAITPTNTEKNRLRRKLGLDSQALDNNEIDDLYAEAEERYPDYADNRIIMFTAVLLQAVGELKNQAAFEVDYDQNQSSEKASQRFKHLERMEGQVLKDLGRLIAAVDAKSPPAVRFGNMRKVPVRKQEYPDA